MSSKIYQDYEEIEESIKKKLNSISDEHVDKAHKGDMQVHIGNPAQSIVEVAEDFDIIIMSTHGRTGFSRFLLGSVAEKVLRMSKIPVMVVENESEVDDFKKILVTTDFSENAVAAYPKALELAKKTGGTVDILHILSFDQFEDDETDPSIKKIREQRMKLIEKEYFHEIGDRVKSYTLVSEDSPHVAIQKYTKSTPYNIIVMSTIGKTGINYLMMGSTTANVVRHVKTAVLSVRPEPKE
jgi:nucleotide-binding universal stress UspA family protein